MAFDDGKCAEYIISEITKQIVRNNNNSSSRSLKRTHFTFVSNKEWKCEHKTNQK